MATQGKRKFAIRLGGTTAWLLVVGALGCTTGVVATQRPWRKLAESRARTEHLSARLAHANAESQEMAKTLALLNSEAGQETIVRENGYLHPYERRLRIPMATAERGPKPQR